MDKIRLSSPLPSNNNYTAIPNQQRNFINLILSKTTETEIIYLSEDNLFKQWRKSCNLYL